MVYSANPPSFFLDKAKKLQELAQESKAQHKFQESAGYYRELLTIVPDHLDALHSLGIIAHMQKEYEEAVRCYKAFLALQPNALDVLELLSLLLITLQRYEEAVPYCRHGITLQPQHRKLLHFLGIALAECKHYEEAAQHFHTLVTLFPDEKEGYQHLFLCLKKLENVGERVLAYYKKVTGFFPEEADFHNDMGSLLDDKHHYAEAIACFTKAIAIQPGHRFAYGNLGASLQQLGRYAEAEAAYKQGIACCPDNTSSLWVKLGKLYELQAWCDKALECYHNAIITDPANKEAAFLRSILQMLTSDLKDGLAEYEMRWSQEGVTSRHQLFPYPWWQGEDLQGKTLLIWREQGIGDDIMFASMMPYVVQRCEKCIIEVMPRLVPMFQRAFPMAEIIECTIEPDARIANTPIDFQIPMGSLMRWVLPYYTPAHHLPYFSADSSKAAVIAERYRAMGALRIGISWHTTNKPTGKQRNIHLYDLRDLFTIPDTHFFNLQYGDHSVEITALKQETGVVLYTDTEIDPLQDMESFAAQVACMDLVISIANSTVHMAGSMGVPTWVLTPTVPSWRWGMVGEGNVWYNSVKLFRQQEPGQWHDVIAAMAGELRKRVGA